MNCEHAWQPNVISLSSVCIHNLPFLMEKTAENGHFLVKK